MNHLMNIKSVSNPERTIPIKMPTISPCLSCRPSETRKFHFLTLSTPPHRAIRGIPPSLSDPGSSAESPTSQNFRPAKDVFSFLSALNFRVILCHKTFTRVNGGNVFQVIPGPVFIFSFFAPPPLRSFSSGFSPFAAYLRLVAAFSHHHHQDRQQQQPRVLTRP